MKKPVDHTVLSKSSKILREFHLCDSCLGRLFVKKLHLRSARLLGKKIKLHLDYQKTHQCYICKDLLYHLDPYVERLVLISENTSYSTFLVGVILKPSLMDRDDFIRSKFKTRGIDSIKTEITKHLTRLFSKKSGKTVDYDDPDLTFLVNFRTDMCKQRTKSIVISGRYIKSKRGLPQRQWSCSDCGGRGCIFCNNRGITEFDSIEGTIAQFFYKHYECTQVKFTWIGGEDKNSLVLGSGRLFFARLVNPKKRNSRLSRQINLGSVSVHALCKVKQIPIEPIRFQSCISVYVHADYKISSLSKLRHLTKTLILVRDGSKSVKRTIHSLSYTRKSPDSFVMNLVCDGGISVKKLVEGGIEPNVSDLLGSKCTCVRFDFKDITIH